ncbi:MAG: enoyl-CoA hydratase-related protein [Planctomycetota bacterium]|nr:enoyl-CoA hydratase-related protein [Planctomycetota bacterium]
MSGYQTILVEVDDRLATVTFNRPEKRNAIDRTMVDELDDALDGLVTGGVVAACVFTGAGDKAFVGGADIAQLRERRAADALQTINAALFNKIEALPFPTIAAVSGYCLGGGCELSMCCDLRVAGEGAKFGQPEVALGIIPAAGGTQRLPRLVGLGHAKDLVLTGRIIDAAEAARIGLVNRVVPDDEVLSAGRDLARTILKNGALAVRLAKLNLNNSSRTGQDGALLLEQISQAVLFESEDKFKRMGDFLERKKKKKKSKS